MANSSLKVALISYEYPPDTSGGGIGTYVKQLANLLVGHNHIVEVFCGTPKPSYSTSEGELKIHRIQSQDSNQFRELVVLKFRSSHEKLIFDVAESPDYGADGYGIKMAFPKLPYTVKLHSPTYIINQYNNYYKQYGIASTWLTKLKKFIHWMITRNNNPYKKEDDIEFQNVQFADLILSPSKGLLNRVTKDWRLNLKPTILLPNLYEPILDLLSLTPSLGNRRITLIGKMSILKGLVDCNSAIDLVLSKMPQLKFRFIGPDSFSPNSELSMKESLLKQNGKWASQIEFTGKIPLSEIPKYLSETDILLCVSLWENFPTVILEGMSAARVLIGTKVGGIPEMIINKKNGYIIPSKNPKALAKAILHIYRNPKEALNIALNGREYVKTHYSIESLYPQIIRSYRQTINICQTNLSL